MSRRYLAGISVAAVTVALSASLGGTALARTSAASSGARAAARPVLGPPLGHATPAHSAPFMTAGASSPWHSLHAPFFPGTMLLASDGTVLVHSEPESGGTSDWYRLTPNAHGSYVHGTWSQIASMPADYDPLYFASAILPDGRMIVEGGEYLGGDEAWTNKGAIYNPVTNKWHRVAPPDGWDNIGDAQSIVLANGTFMLSQACQDCLSPNFKLSTADALFNATDLGWNPLSGRTKNDPNDEESWTLQPNGQLLTVDTWLAPTTELFTPSHLSWATAGNTPKSPVNAEAAEIGPQVLLPNGDTFVVGAGSGQIAPEPCTTHTPAANALYSGGQWVHAPSIPTMGGLQYDSADGPAAVLPDGNALFDVSPCVFNAPIAFELYNAQTRTLSPVPNVPNAANDSTYYTRLLDLPNGQVLFNDGSHQMEVYTDGGTPNPDWAPQIYSMSTQSLHPGKTASLGGAQLAGLDQGAAYGDDAQENTNFPLVRITNSATGVVTYARTSDWSSVSVAPGATSTTNFTLPANTPTGQSVLQVVANGIASQPVPVTVS